MHHACNYQTWYFKMAEDQRRGRQDLKEKQPNICEHYPKPKKKIQKVCISICLKMSEITDHTCSLQLLHQSMSVEIVVNSVQIKISGFRTHVAYLQNFKGKNIFH